MKASEFNFERYRDYYEKTQKNLLDFDSNRVRRLMVAQRPSATHFGVDSHTKEDSLSAQLDSLNEAMMLHGDLSFNYLTPWHGVGVFATAFGAKVKWYPHTSMQTLCCYDDVEEVADVPYPDIAKCEYLQMILDTIRYFRDQTGDAIPISLTDTQSPNDTASLILDASALFEASLDEPEALQDFLGKVTRLIQEFSDLEIETIGEGNASFPGHQMFSDPSFRGISLSDDNMAVISPASYRDSSLAFNQQLGRHFHGAAMHSCGVSKHNLSQLFEIDHLKIFECAVGYGDKEAPTDPNPNSAADLLPWFADKDVTLKVRVGPKEIERVFPLLTPRVKLQIELCTYGTVDERNRQYDEAMEIMLQHYK